MKTFENFEVLTVAQPSDQEVLARIRRDEPCRADPASTACTSPNRDEYLLGDGGDNKICHDCAVMVRKRQEILAAWEEWCLAMQDVYS